MSNSTPHPCNCLFCTGEHGRRLVCVHYELADAAGLVQDAKRNRVTIKPKDQIFVVDGFRAVACVRFVRRKLARLCGCWVDPSFRQQGLGSMLVTHRIAYLERHTSVAAIDTFAFHRNLFARLGFEERQSFKVGTTLWRKVVAR